MRGPQARGSVTQALAPLAALLSTLEERALLVEPMSVVEMATALAATMRGVARHALELVLDQAARAQVGQQPCKCGQMASSSGFEKTHYIGRFGKVPIERRRFVCACGVSGFPFDAAWQLPAGEYSDDVREVTERMALRNTFEEAVIEVNHFWGVAPDATTAKRWVGQDGPRAASAVRADADASWARYAAQGGAAPAADHPDSRRHPGFGVVEVDGVHAVTWKPGLEPRRKQQPAVALPACDAPAATGIGDAVVAGEREDRHLPPSTLSSIAGSPMGPTGRSPRVHGREVLVGLTYVGENACEESPGRGALLHRRYVSTLDDREGFWTDLHAAVTSEGALAREKLVRVTDGGAHIIERTDELFAGEPLVPVLDCQHAKQHIWDAGHQLASGSDVPDWVLPRTRSLMDGNVETVIAGLADERARHTRGKKAKALDALSGYLGRHKHMMNYPAYAAAGFPIASAAIESANKRLVSRRCKQGGMIWSEPGLEAMIAVRVAFHNPQTWEGLWPHLGEGAP